MTENKKLNQDSKIIIVGAGIAGITLGNLLISKGFKPLILEKSRGVGGRIATRRHQNGKWDHGIPAIEFKSLPSWAMESWKPVLVPVQLNSGPCFVSPNGLTHLAKSLTSSQEILKESKVSHLELTHTDPKWIVHDEKEQHFSANCIVFAIPAPQVLEILQRSHLLESSQVWNSLKSIQYRPHIVLLAKTESGDILNYKSDLKPPFELISDNGVKGIQNSNGFLSIYCNEQFSRDHFDKADDWILNLCKDRLFSEYGLRFSHIEVKRWRYSRAEKALPVPFLEAPTEAPLYFIGDGFSGGDLNGALRSAWELARLF